MGRILLFLFFCTTSFLTCASVETARTHSDREAASRPNILIAISDDQSYPYASAYGSRSTRTPHFDRVAREGVLFMNAFVASPGCSPSRAALLTGRYPWQIEHAGTHASYFSPDYVVFPDLLEEAGYAVGFTGKGWGPGDWRFLGRTRNPAGPEFNERRIASSPPGINDKDYAANFDAFLEQRDPEQPFYFWYGAHEPHRVFEEGAGRKAGKRLYEAEVPPFFPDDPVIRSDILDYAYEIEHFDTHLGRMLARLEALGELENTLVIVTSDNGMAFPRAKANTYEYGIHVPLAIMWADEIPGGRQVDDLVSLVDLHPTLLEAADTPHPDPDRLSGASLMPLLRSAESDLVDSSRTAVYAARERHSSSRFNSLSYSQRALRTHDFLYIRNFTPDRWPAGAPQKYDTEGLLGPMHGGYHDIDAAPSLSYLIDHRDDPNVDRYFHLAVDLRPPEELYDINKDPGCLINLANAPGFLQIKDDLGRRLHEYLTATGDPRVLGHGDVFETYPRVSGLRWFPEPYWVDGDEPPFRPEWLDRESR